MTRSAYDAAVEFVCTRLTEAGVDTPVWEGLAPEKATYPLITVQPGADPRHTNYTGARAMTTVDLLIRVWTLDPSSEHGNADTAQGIADLVDAALNYTPVRDLDGASMRGCVALAESTPFIAEESGYIKRARGGRFRVFMSPLD